MVMMSPEEVKASTPLLRLALFYAFVLSGLMIVVGAMALIWGEPSNTVISVLGFNITTGNVAVALVGLGAVTAVIVIKKVLDVVTQLAKLK